MGSTSVQYRFNGYWVRSKKIVGGTTTTGATILEVPAGTLVAPQSVCIVITSAFSGGTPSIDIGDSDIDGWIDTTAITEGTAGTYGDVDAGYMPTGKYYSAADTINITCNTDLSAGKAYVFAYFIPVADVISD